MPWPAERMLPTITWSTWSPSTPERERTSLPTVAPRSVAGVSLSAPPKVPIPVLKGVEMTTSPLPLPLPKLTLYSFRLHLIKGYLKRQSPGRAVRASSYSLQSAALPLLVGPPLYFVQVAPVVGKHGVEEVHIGVGRFLDKRLGGLPLLALLLDQILREAPVVLGLSPKAVDDAVEEFLPYLGVEFLGRDGTIRDGLVGLFKRVGELLSRFVYLLLLLRVHDLTSSF